MAGRRIGYLVSLAGCFVFYICYERWLGWLLFVCMLGLPWISLLLSMGALWQFQLRVEAPGRVSQGAAVELSLYGGCHFPIPPFRGRIGLTHFPSGSRSSGRRLPTEHCGGVVCRPEKGRVYDYLGLFCLPVRKKIPETVRIWPKPLAIRDMPELETLLSTGWQPKPGGGFAENHELRPYRPGDSLNQIHWKLTAKTGDTVIREPMEPRPGRLLVTVDISGTPEELDRKFGRLLWLGTYLLERDLVFQIQALTETGIQCYGISGETELEAAMDDLLVRPAAKAGSVLAGAISAAWHCHVGGAPDEQ